MNNLERNAIRNGAGHNQIAWHTIAASGKPLSVGWLCRVLSLLYQTPTGRNLIFNSVIVVTDRKILKKQIRKTIGKLEKTEAVTGPIEETKQQLKKYLETEKSIIVSRIKKFPMIYEPIAQMKDRRFAVIIDAAHFSRQGEAAKYLNDFLSKSALGIYQPHITYFGFNGTHRDKTLKIFEIRGGDEDPGSIDFYSMKQRYLGSICAGCSTKLLYL